MYCLYAVSNIFVAFKYYVWLQSMTNQTLNFCAASSNTYQITFSHCIQCVILYSRLAHISPQYINQYHSGTPKKKPLIHWSGRRDAVSAHFWSVAWQHRLVWAERAKNRRKRCTGELYQPLERARKTTSTLRLCSRSAPSIQYMCIFIRVIPNNIVRREKREQEHNLAPYKCTYMCNWGWACVASAVCTQFTRVLLHSTFAYSVRYSTLANEFQLIHSNRVSSRLCRALGIHTP